MWGKKEAATKVIENLDQVFREVQQKYGCAVGDFPELNGFREKLAALDLSKFPKINKKTMSALDDALSNSIPRLIELMNQNDSKALSEMTATFNPFDDNAPNVVAHSGQPNVMENWGVLRSTHDKAVADFETMQLNG